MELGLAGKVILVTGAGQGLGRAIGLAFAAEHAHVAFHYHSSADGAQGAAHQAQALGVKTLAVGADLRLEADVVAAVDRIERELGPIDVLINNAAATQRKLFLETRPEDWAAQIDVTVKGTLLITHAVVGRMAARRSGAIVNLMGDSGRVGESRLLVTATARAAAVGLTRSLAREFARSAIRHFDVHAGGPSEGMTDERLKKIVAQYPLGRVGRADDVTPMVLLLASPRASWITGQVVSVNGGYAML